MPDQTISIARFEVSQDLERDLPKGEETSHVSRNKMRIRKQKQVRDSISIISREVTKRLTGERVPLILVGPANFQHVFREVHQSRNLLSQGIECKLDDLDINGVVQLTERLVSDYFAESDREAIAAFRRADSVGLGSTDLDKIAAAAVCGQVQSLLIAEDRLLWRRIDRETGHVDLFDRKDDRPSDDLLDDIAEIVMLKGGKVTVLPENKIPGGRPIAAVLRWVDVSMPGVPSLSACVSL
jgi:hypothetical protein